MINHLKKHQNKNDLIRGDLLERYYFNVFDFRSKLKIWKFENKILENQFH